MRGSSHKPLSAWDYVVAQDLADLERLERDWWTFCKEQGFDPHTGAPLTVRQEDDPYLDCPYSGKDLLLVAVLSFVAGVGATLSALLWVLP